MLIYYTNNTSSFLSFIRLFSPFSKNSEQQQQKDKNIKYQSSLHVLKSAYNWELQVFARNYFLTIKTILKTLRIRQKNQQKWQIFLVNHERLYFSRWL